MKNTAKLLSLTVVLIIIATCLFACAPHVCEFVEVSRTVTCTKDGTISYECSCGEKKTEDVKALGHKYDETSFSRIPWCQNPGCKVNTGTLPKTTSEFRKQVKYTFTEDDKTRIDAAYEALKATLEGYGEYDETLHAYEKDSEWDVKNAEFEESFLAFEDELKFVIAQYQYAQIQSDRFFPDEEYQNNYLEISNYYNELFADYNSLFPLVHETPLREYFFYGWTEEEIAEVLEETTNASNPRWVELSNRNDELENQYDNLNDAQVKTGEEVLEVYAEFVANNKEIAQILGYDNYMDYAYEKVYDREYSPVDSEAFYQNVKKYIVPLYEKYSTAWDTALASATSKQVNDLVDFMYGSFFTTPVINKAVNDFMTEVKTTNAEGQEVSYYDHLNELIKNQNYFTGSAANAYSWYIESLETPILFFGNNVEYGLRSGNTVVHEFGHYCNELKNHEYSQSFDLAETHSQGLEVLYLRWLEENKSGFITQTVFDLYSSYTLAHSFLSTILRAAGVDAFERAVYTNTYAGPGADKIMADGQITADEYDTLAYEIMNELGVGDDAYYWRAVAVSNPGYYISYSVSMTCALQLYSSSMTFDESVQAYLKLVNYSDVEEQIEFNYKQILEYAGLYNHTEEELFLAIQKSLF